MSRVGSGLGFADVNFNLEAFNAASGRDARAKAVARRNEIITNGMLQAVQDPTEPFVAPKPKDDVPYLDFAPLQNAADALTRSAERYQTALDKVTKNGGLGVVFF